MLIIESSGQFVMVATGEQASEDFPDSENGELSIFNCPVCSKELSDLRRLNYHLDNDHSFGEPQELATHPVNKQVKGRHKRDGFVAGHLKAFEPGISCCHECGRLLRKGTGIVNCHKCGELFCGAHCRNTIKLDSHGRYDPQKGRWYVCCYKCFGARPGYNDYGSSRELTETLKSLRTMKNEDKQLRIIQLENRLVRLLDGIIAIIRQYKGSLLEGFRVQKDISKLERTVTSWRDDNEATHCNICNQVFDITLRRHHCRLCGNIVCDSRSTNCSNQVPIYNLMNAANDLPFTEATQELVSDNVSIRLCSECIHNLFFQRKFKKEVRQPLSPLLSQCESISNTSRVIIQLTASLGDIERIKSISQAPEQFDVNESNKLRAKLLRAVASYHQSTKQISMIKPKNNAEKKIQQSVRMASSIFIDEKVLQLKSLPCINPPQIYHAPESQEVVKLSNFLADNLSIKEIKEIKQFREELMVLKEQAFLVETMIENAKKQRNFEEINILNGNLQELESRMQTIQEYLGDQSFA